ncbi:MAG TPA: IscS subfamily cysteine desulfurase, partial [Dissulfurispiraceae bacterium]
MAELAKRLGYGHLYPQNEEELLRHVLQGSGFTLEDVRAAGGTVQVPSVMMQYRKWEKGLLRPDGRPGFDTPTGKLEFASTILEEYGYDPLPVYTEPHEGPVSRPELAKKYPLVFNSGSRVITDFRSQHHGIPGLSGARPEPTVTINALDAEARGIKSGDQVYVKSPRGQVLMRALVTDDIVQGAVDANMGGGGPVGPEAWRKCNINELTDLERHDLISGFPVYKALLCDVKRADGDKKAAAAAGSGEYGSPAGMKRAGRGQEECVRIYLDHNATTPLHAEAHEAMRKAMGKGYGNPSGIYREGRDARFSLESARRGISHLINCTAKRIVFTGGGSEANNLALKGAAFAAMRGERNHIITTRIEHHSVLAACEWLEGRGFEVTYLAVDKTGMVPPDDLARAITERTFLVSIMAANNETGTIQPVKELSSLAKERGVLFHTDAVQALGKIPVDVEALGVDLLTMSGHKICGPKGVGALYVRKGVVLEPLVHGGKQEGGLRAGTENTIGISGFGKAAEIASRNLFRMEGIRELRDRLEEGIKGIIPGASLNGHARERLPNTLNLTLPGMRGESMVLALDQRGVSLSSGSACRAGSPEPSHVLLAMGVSREEAHCAVRLSLGLETTPEEIERTISLFGEVVRGAGETIRFVPCR